MPIVSAYALYFLGGGTQFGLSFQAEKMIITPGAARDVLDDFVTSKPLKVTDDAPLGEPAEVVLDTVKLEDDYAAM